MSEKLRLAPDVSWLKRLNARIGLKAKGIGDHGRLYVEKQQRGGYLFRVEDGDAGWDDPDSVVELSAEAARTLAQWIIEQEERQP